MIVIKTKLQDTGKQKYINIAKVIIDDLDIKKGDVISLEYVTEGEWKLRKNNNDI